MSMIKHPIQQASSSHASIHPRLDRRYLILLLLMSLTLTGCHRLCCLPWWPGANEHVEIFVPPSNGFSITFNPKLPPFQPQRVLLVASARHPGQHQPQQMMIQELATQLRGKGICEVVAPNSEKLHGHSDNILQGKFDERELIDLSRKYNADVIGLVRVNELRIVSPIRTSLTVAFIDANESVVGCGIDGVWDLAETGTQAAFMNHLERAGIKEYELELRKDSPTSLFRFASDELTAAMLQSR